MTEVLPTLHGGLDRRELAALGIAPERTLDLSANLHRWGPSPAMRAALAAASWESYPPADAAPLRAAIAAHAGVDTSMVLPTPGATAAIHLLARLVQPGDTVAILGPTFGEYRVAARHVDARVVEVNASPPAFEAPIALTPIAVLGFVCTPNNPTGVVLSRAAVEQVAARLGGLLVVDTAYAEFAHTGWNAVDMVRDGLRIAVVRSLTKTHAIPGVRLGYVVAPPDVIARLSGMQPAWALDAAAHAAAPVALAEVAARRTDIDAMRVDRERLRATLRTLGCAVAPGEANFLLAEVGDARGIRIDLARRGYLVRDCASFGLPTWIRLAVPPSGALSGLEEALRAVLGGSPPGSSGAR